MQTRPFRKKNVLKCNMLSSFYRLPLGNGMIIIFLFNDNKTLVSSTWGLIHYDEVLRKIHNWKKSSVKLRV